MEKAKSFLFSPKDQPTSHQSKLSAYKRYKQNKLTPKSTSDDLIKSTKQTSEEYISSISCTSEETRRRSDNYKPFRKYDLSSPITKASENYETLDYKLQSSESKTNSKSKVFDFMDTPDFKNPMRDSSICKDAYQSTSSHFTSTSCFKNVNEESFSHDIKLKSSLRRNISILHNKEFKVQTKFNHDAGLNSMIAAEWEIEEKNDEDEQQDVDDIQSLKNALDNMNISRHAQRYDDKNYLYTSEETFSSYENN